MRTTIPLRRHEGGGGRAGGIPPRHRQRRSRLPHLLAHIRHHRWVSLALNMIYNGHLGRFDIVPLIDIKLHFRRQLLQGQVLRVHRRGVGRALHPRTDPQQDRLRRGLVIRMY